jgi:hypothetical protein
MCRLQLLDQLLPLPAQPNHPADRRDCEQAAAGHQQHPDDGRPGQVLLLCEQLPGHAAEHEEDRGERPTDVVQAERREDDQAEDQEVAIDYGQGHPQHGGPDQVELAGPVAASARTEQPEPVPAAETDGEGQHRCRRSRGLLVAYCGKRGAGGVGQDQVEQAVPGDPPPAPGSPPAGPGVSGPDRRS